MGIFSRILVSSTETSFAVMKTGDFERTYFMKSFNKIAACFAALLFCTPHVNGELLVLYEGEVVNTANAQVVLDSSGKNNHGIFLGDGEIEFGAGKTGNALGFPDTAGTTMRVNPAGFGAFDSIFDSQAFTVGFWLAGEESAGEAGGPGDPPDPAPINPRNQSAFWAVGAEGETDRAFQSHLPWSNSNVYLDVGGCCAADQRVNGVIDRELWDSETGEEWTHWAFTVDGDFGDAAVYANGEEVLFRDGPTAIIPALSALWVGSAPNAANRMSGRMDDFFITDDTLGIGDLETIIADGAGSFFGTSAPEPYTPSVEVNADLSVVDGKLAGSASVSGAEIGSWSVDEVVRIQAGGSEVVEYVSLAAAGVSGDGTTIGDTLAALGDLPLVNSGADNVEREFRLNLDLVNSTDEVIGAAFTSTVTKSLLLEGSGGGGVDPFTLLGDLDQDNKIAFSDFLILSANFGAVKGEAQTPSVPEPSTGLMGVFAIASLCILRRRR